MVLKLASVAVLIAWEVAVGWIVSAWGVEMAGKIAVLGIGFRV